MHDEFQYLTELPGTPKKQSWVQDRLEILSEWERVMLTAVTAQQPPPLRRRHSTVCCRWNTALYSLQ